MNASIQTDMSNQHFGDFREYGAFLARHGLTDQQALEVMTLNGARAMMLEDRVGSIEEGKDADLVLLDGHFLDLTADRVERVFVDGRLEYERRPRAAAGTPPQRGALHARDGFHRPGTTNPSPSPGLTSSPSATGRSRTRRW